MRNVWFTIIITLLFSSIFVSSILGLYFVYEKESCKEYERVGFEIKVDLSAGCQVFIDGEFRDNYELKRYLRIKELSELKNFALGEKEE